MTEGTNQGLFVIVAIVIFGVFVALAYFLFRDMLTPGIANIFEDSILQTEYAIGKNSGDPKYKTEKIDRVDESTGRSYAKIREADSSKGWTEVWVELETVTKDGQSYFKIIKSSISDSNYVAGDKKMTGDLVIPAYMEDSEGNILPVKEVGYDAFFSALFDGSINALSIEVFDHYSFGNSKFKGEFLAPNAKKIGYLSFWKSEFTGVFNGENIEEIGESGLAGSRFTGDFIAPKLRTIGDDSFFLSEFTGDFVAPALTSITTNMGLTFANSTFSGNMDAPKLKYVTHDCFKNSKFKVSNNNSPYLQGTYETYDPNYSYYK